MKKIIIMTIAVALLSSCKKEEKEVRCDSSCGVVTNDGIDSSNGINYWLEVQNDCSSVKKRWYVSSDTWYNYAVGETICFSSGEASQGW